MSTFANRYTRFDKILRACQRPMTMQEISDEIRCDLTLTRNCVYKLVSLKRLTNLKAATAKNTKEGGLFVVPDASFGVDSTGPKECAPRFDATALLQAWK